jgi:hypothetical protein
VPTGETAKEDHDLGRGVAVSIGGLILFEYFALTRLVHAIGAWRIRPVTLAIGG